MTPRELAEELGLSNVRVNGILRELFPRGPGERHQRWDLSGEQVQVVRERVGRGHQPDPTPTRSPAASARLAWDWEGNVQARIVTYLASEGWQIVSVADTARKERGDDIRARRAGKDLVVEVKGYPSVGYADPARAGETKATSPTLQAQHWLADAVLTSLRTLGGRPGPDVAIGLPRRPRYEHLLAEIDAPLRRLGVLIYLVDPDGAVSLHTPAPKRGPRVPNQSTVTRV